MFIEPEHAPKPSGDKWWVIRISIEYRLAQKHESHVMSFEYRTHLIQNVNFHIEVSLVAVRQNALAFSFLLDK